MGEISNFTEENSNPFVSVTIMAFNEEAVIDKQVMATIAFFEGQGIAFEVLVVDDGSTDKTGEKVRMIAGQDPRVRLLRHEVNQGMGVSIRDGYMASSGTFVTQLPGDMQVTADVFERFLPFLDDHDMVLSTYRRRDDGRLRRVVSLGFRAATRGILGYWCAITGTMFIRRSLLEGLSMRSDTFMVNCEIPLRLMRKGVKPAFVEIEAQSRPSGGSKVLRLGRIARVVQEMLKLRRTL